MLKLLATTIFVTLGLIMVLPLVFLSVFSFNVFDIEHLKKWWSYVWESITK